MKTFKTYNRGTDETFWAIIYNSYSETEFCAFELFAQDLEYIGFYLVHGVPGYSLYKIEGKQ
jgi:hypothetical protein